MKQDVISLTTKQLNKLDIINRANDNLLTVADAAQALGLSNRQIQRLKKEVRLHGPAALIHKNSLRKPSHAITDNLASRILSIRAEDPYSSSNFMHFRDLLSEYKNIEVSYSALYNLLRKNSILSPKKRRRYKPHRRRKRRPQAGLLLQVDATPFDWFRNGKMYSLHGGIDDATGQITGLFLCKNECMLGYFEMLRRTIENFGIPVSLYADRHTIFRSPKADKLSLEEQMKGVKANDTQLGRSLRELNVELIAARSPQAKGRVERLWETLQSRLPVELALAGIQDIDATNEFLQHYIYKYNSQFAVEPELSEKAFRNLSTFTNLDYILCLKETRIIDRGHVFSYGGKNFQMLASNYADQLPPRCKIQVLISPSVGVKVQWKGIIFDTIRFLSQREKQKPICNKPAPSSGETGAKYFKYGQSLYKGIVVSETQEEILEMLEDLYLRKRA